MMSTTESNEVGLIDRNNERLGSELQDDPDSDYHADFREAVTVTNTTRKFMENQGNSAERFKSNDSIGSMDSSTATLASSQASIVRSNVGHDGGKRPSSGSISLQVRVEMGLLGWVPPSMRISENRIPCAIFAVVDVESQNTIWRFAKEYEQLSNFNNLLHMILEPLLRSSKVILRDFPQRDWFLKNIPWQVDVRNDMLNAYFKSIAWLNGNNYYQREKAIQSSVERALSALWLYDVVEIPLAMNKYVDSEIRGYLLSRSIRKPKEWVCHYSLLNGGFLDFEALEGEPRASINLTGAHVQLKVVFFNARNEEDERYAFTVYEKSGKHFKAHLFSTESEKVRKLWLTQLKKRIGQINKGEIDHKAKFYGSKNLPRLYELRESPHRSPYTVKSTNGKSNSKATKKANNITLEASNSKHDLFHGKRSVDVLDRLSIYDNLQIVEGNEPRNPVYDGGDFYMKISNPKVISKVYLQNKSLRSDSSVHSEGGIKPNSLNLPYAISPNTFKETNIYELIINDTMNSKQNNSSVSYTGKVFGILPSKCHYLKTLKNNDKVPSVIARCVERLQDPVATSELGIFRISGTQTLIDELQEEFDTEGDFDLVKAHVDVHTTADLLKRYLRSLPGYLLGNWTESKSKSFMPLSESDQIEIIRIEMEDVESINKATIKVILLLLNEVSAKQSVNSMGLENLGVALSTALRVPSPILSLYIKYAKGIL